MPLLLSDLRTQLDQLTTRLDLLKGSFNAAGIEAQIAEADRRMHEPTFWGDPTSANVTMKSLKALKDIWTPWQEALKEAATLQELLPLIDGQNEKELAELAGHLDILRRDVERIELQQLLGSANDRRSAILSLNAGAGGTESCDWTSMLLRMYERWAETRGYSVQTIDFLPGEGAGFRNATVLIEGDYAYGYLRSEIGVHRLVRISPFDANKRRHTSFASADVTPEIGDDIAIDIKEDELRIDTYRSSGAGGQHVNKTDSAVRITHLPTGVVVQCQNERSQRQNKLRAMTVLRSKLYDMEERKRREALDRLSGEKQKIEWGSQIRSYVLHPYSMVKDHRTDHETPQADKVLDGEFLTPFMEAYLRWTAQNKGERAKTV